MSVNRRVVMIRLRAGWTGRAPEPYRTRPGAVADEDSNIVRPPRAPTAFAWIVVACGAIDSMLMPPASSAIRATVAGVGATMPGVWSCSYPSRRTTAGTDANRADACIHFHSRSSPFMMSENNTDMRTESDPSERATSLPRPPDRPAGCCDPTLQRTCCEPAERPTCCIDPTSGSCGCR